MTQKWRQPFFATLEKSVDSVKVHIRTHTHYKKGRISEIKSEKRFFWESTKKPGKMVTNRIRYPIVSPSHTFVTFYVLFASNFLKKWRNFIEISCEKDQSRNFQIKKKLFSFFDHKIICWHFDLSKNMPSWAS